MDLFELLFIALFILFPILDQLFRRGKKSPPGEPDPDEPGPDPLETRPGEVSPRSSSREPVKASDMVPDDLWAVLTGEERRPEGVQVEGEATPRPATAETPPTEEPARWEQAWTPRPEPRWRMDEVEEAPATASVEHHAPEAYSLETFEREAVSLETPIASPESRHRRFHEILDRPAPRRATRRSRIGRALQTSTSVRQAFVLSEVLGPPKGME